MYGTKQLAGKVALITGGGSGQGRVTSVLFARQGAHVVVADRNLEGANETVRQIRETGGEAVAVRADVSQERDVQAMVAVGPEAYGRLDILFNNAGIWSATGRFMNMSVVDTPEEHWDTVMAVNLKGVALGCKHAIPVMVRQGGGVIINNASIDALVAMPGADAYTASKGGIVALTRVLAADWGPRGIRVNCICPGEVDTPMTAAVLRHPKTVQFTLANCPLQRVAEPEEIARVALFLASDAAAYVHGAIVAVDGGWTAR